MLGSFEPGLGAGGLRARDWTPRGRSAAGSGTDGWGLGPRAGRRAQAVTRCGGGLADGAEHARRCSTRQSLKGRRDRGARRNAARLADLLDRADPALACASSRLGPRSRISSSRPWATVRACIRTGASARPSRSGRRCSVYVDRGGSLREEKRVLRSTRHGPLIEWLSDEPGEGPGREGRSSGSAHGATARALAWTGARPGDGLTSMLALLRLEHADGVASALAHTTSPCSRSPTPIARAGEASRSPAGCPVARSRRARSGPGPVAQLRLAPPGRDRRAAGAAVLGEAPEALCAAADQPWPSEVEPRRRRVPLATRRPRRADRGELDRRLRSGPPRPALGGGDVGRPRDAPRAGVVRALLALARRERRSTSRRRRSPRSSSTGTGAGSE